MKRLVVGSRRSQLAMTQTHWVCDQLTEYVPDLDICIEGITTKGDRILDLTLSKIGGKGLFIKEIEQALLDGRIDFAVHSMKDMPAEMPEGLVIASVPARVDARDAFISRSAASLRGLPQEARIGTSSLRRTAQLARLRSDLTIVPLRGNIDSRLEKMREGKMDAIVLACAGLIRMGWEDQITERLSVEQSIPAVAQGALAIQCRSEDLETRSIVGLLNDETTARTVAAERAFLGALNGGCQVPIGAYASAYEHGLRLVGMVAEPDGSVILKESLDGAAPEALGRQLAALLLDQGARGILERFREKVGDR